MAKFNPDEAIRSQESNARFDPGAANRSGMPNKYQSVIDMMSGTQYEPQQRSQPELATEDFTSGVRAGLQNPLAYATKKLPSQFQVQNFQPAPSSKAGTLPITLGKMYAAMLPSTGAEKLVAGGIGLAGKIPGAIKVAEKIPGWVSRVISGTAGGMASAPSVDASPETGAFIGAGGAGAMELGAGLLGRYLGRNVTPEQFESAREAIPEGIKSPIGELADSPRAKTQYGKARGIALSQADTPYQQLFDHLRQETKSLTSDVPNVSNPSQYVYDDIEKSYESAKDITKKDYDKLGKYADENDVPFNRTALDGELDSSIKELEGKIINKTTKKHYGKTLDSLKDFRDTKINTFSDATNLRPTLNDLIKDASKGADPDLVGRRHLLKMKKGLDESIAISSAEGDPRLLELHEAANNSRIHQATFEKLNRKDSTPFYKIYSKGGTPDNLIGSHIRTSTKGDDHSGLLAALTEKLSPKAKGVLAKAYLQPTEDTSLAKQIGKIEKLSPTQRDLMFGDKAPEAHSISKIAGLYPSAASADFTPTTGYTGAKITQLLTEMGGLSSGLGVGAATHSPAIAAGTVAAASALPAYGQLTQRALRSEALKNAHMRYLQRAGKEALTKATPAGQAMRTGLLALLGGNQNGA